MTYLSVTILAAYLYMNVGKRPGYIAFEVNEDEAAEELNIINENQFQVYMHNNSNNEDMERTGLPGTDHLDQDSLDDGMEQRRGQDEEDPFADMMDSRSGL